MKSRLSSTIWALVLLNGLVFLVVLWLAFGAGKKAGEASLFDFGSPAGGSIIFALVLALGTSVILAWRFGALVRPVQALAEFSERVRKAAMEVTACSNNILVAADEMQAGATQQDQEITNTSSAVEELTVSMKQVSNNAEASAEAARRALDAAEQGNRAVRDTLEGMQRIRASVQATAKKIKSLGDRSLEISEIINVI